MNRSANVKIIAIDGPAGSGKSTIAKALAKRLNLEYLDTGAMYRAVAFLSLQQSVETSDDQRVLEVAEEMDFNFTDGICVVNGHDVTKEIRSAEGTETVSAGAAMPEVRKEMVKRQRIWVEERGGGVVEGRAPAATALHTTTQQTTNKKKKKTNTKKHKKTTKK